MNVQAIVEKYGKRRAFHMRAFGVELLTEIMRESNGKCFAGLTVLEAIKQLKEKGKK